MTIFAPTLSGNNLTVDLALKQPSRITNRIAELTAKNTLVDKFFHPRGAAVTGGAVLYNVLKASDYYVNGGEVRQRAPGAEYEFVSGEQPETKIAYVEDWGGVFSIFDEAIIRNDIRYFDDQVTQLANTITKKLDTRAMAAIADALADGAQTIIGHSWEDLVTIGDPTLLTPSGELPTADLSMAQLGFASQELGITPDLLIVNPAQAHSLRVAYGDKLEAMLKSVGMELFENMRIEQGVAYVVQRGQAGEIAFEKTITTEAWREPKNKTTYVQSYVHATFAVDKPYAVKKLTGLNAA